MFKILHKQEKRIILNMDCNNENIDNKDNQQHKTKSESNLIQQYYNSLSEIEKVAFKIAEKQLETSFDVVKTIGFNKWIKDNNIKL